MPRPSDAARPPPQCVRFAPEDARRVADAAGRAGLRPSSWVRSRVLGRALFVSGFGRSAQALPEASARQDGAFRTLCIRFTEDGLAKVRAAAARERRPLLAWIRDVAVADSRAV